MWIEHDIKKYRNENCVTTTHRKRYEVSIMLGESFRVPLKGNSGNAEGRGAGVEGNTDASEEKAAFFSREGDYGSATNLEKYRESEKHRLAAISERNSSGDNSIGLRARRFASVDDSYTRTDLMMDPSNQVSHPEGPKGFWSWLGVWASPSDENEGVVAGSGDGFRSKSEGSTQSAASKRLMRQITMENVLEGVENTPLSSKLSLSLYRTDTDTFRFVCLMI